MTLGPESNPGHITGGQVFLKLIFLTNFNSEN